MIYYGIEREKGARGLLGALRYPQRPDPTQNRCARIDVLTGNLIDSSRQRERQARLHIVTIPVNNNFIAFFLHLYFYFCFQAGCRKSFWLGKLSLSFPIDKFGIYD